MAVKHRRLPNGAYETVDNVDANLEAAATPISVEPTAGKPRDIRQEQIDRLVAAGDDPRTAAMVVDRLREINGGEMQAGLFDSYNTPEGNEALRQRIAQGQAANARMAAFETNYNAETGHPEYGYDEAGNAARLGRVDINNRSAAELREAGARRYQHRAPYNAEMEAANHGPGSDYVSSTEVEPFVDATVPGPRTLDGKSPTPSRGLTAEEAEAYNTRKPGQLSQRDADMRARGFVPVVTRDGVRYMLQSDMFDGELLAPMDETGNPRRSPPGGVGRQGSRPDLTESSELYPRGKYETRTELGPDGRDVDVLAPTQDFKDKIAANQKRRSDALAAERKARRDNWQATAMLAGGSQNLNSGNRWIANNLVRMKPEDRDESLRYMLPGGPLAAQVDAAHNEQLSALGLRVATGQGFQNQTPLTAVQAQLAEEQLAAERAKNRASDENVLGEKYAPGDNNWFPGWLGGGYDEFTVAEQQQMYDDLIDQGYKPADAQRAVDRQAQKRRATERQRWGD
jgi:hypothetical protein